MFFDIYKMLPEEWFEQIGDFSDDEEEYSPLNYDEICTALYSGNSFYGPEFVKLLIDEEEKIYYICSAIRQPIGDYGWRTIWGWYKSDSKYYSEITEIINKAKLEVEKDG